MSTLTGRSSGSAAVVVAIGFAAIVFDGYDLIVYGSVLPALLEYPDWELTPAGAGAIGSVSLLGMFFGAIASGWLTDRFGRRRLFIGLLTWFSAMMVLVSLAPSPELLGLFRFLAGLGFGGIPPAAIALVTEVAPPARRFLFNAVMLVGFPLGGVVAALLSVGLLDVIGFRGLFAVGALPLITVVPLAAWLLPETPGFSTRPVTSRSAAGPWSILRGGKMFAATALFSVGNFCGFLLVFGLNTWLPQLMRGAGYDLGSAVGFLLVLNLGAVLGGVFGALISDRIGGKTVATTLFVIGAASLALLGVPGSTGQTLALVFVAGAATVGNQAVLFGYVATHYRTASRATALGLTSGIGRLGAIAGPLVGGFLVTSGIGLTGNVFVFAGVAVVGALAAVAVPRFRREPGLQTAPSTVQAD